MKMLTYGSLAINSRRHQGVIYGLTATDPRVKVEWGRSA